MNRSEDAKIEYIDIDQIDENPDNKTIFNMEDIKTLERSIKANGFIGAIEVFKKPDGRYEISSGHRRVRAMRELGMNQVPCIVNPMPDDVSKARRLIESNMTNRTLHPLDYARSIEYYISYVLKPSGFTGDVNKECADFFNISTSSVYKYRQIVKMIPELQGLANNPQFPYSGFVSAHRLSAEKQLELYDEIRNYSKNHKDDNGNPIEVSRFYIEQTVRKLLKEENRYKEAQNSKIREASVRKEQTHEKLKAAMDNLDNDAAPLPYETDNSIDQTSPFNHIVDDDFFTAFNDAKPDSTETNAIQAELFQKLDFINGEINNIEHDIGLVSDTSRLISLLTPIKEKVDKLYQSISSKPIRSR